MKVNSINIASFRTDLRLLVACAVLVAIALPGLAQTTPTPTPDERVKPALLLFQEAATLYKENTPESLAAAATKFGEARAIFQRFTDKKGEASCLTWMAAANAKIESLQTAIGNLNDAMRIYIELGDLAAEGDIHFSIGNLYARQKDPKSALEHYELAAKISNAIGSKSDEIDALKVIGKAYLDQGDPAKALAYNERALSIARAGSDKEREAEVLANIGSIHLIGGNPQKAAVSFEELLAFARREKLAAYEAGALELLLTAYRMKADTAGMLTVLDQTLKLARDRGDRTAEANALNGIAEAHLTSKSLDEAAKFAEQALKVSVAAGDKPGEGASLLNIGIVQARNNEYAKAIETLRKASPLLEAARDFQKVALGQMVMGGAFEKLGDKKLALEASIEAVTTARIYNIPEIEVEAGNNVGAILLGMGDHARAIEYFRAALSLAHKIGLTEAEGRLRLNLGNALRTAGKNPEALENLEQASGASKGDRIVAVSSLMNKGGVYLDLGENEKALGAYMEAMFMVIGGMTGPGKDDTTVSTELFATLLNNLGRVFHEMGAVRRALDHYQQSLPLLREVKDKDHESITLTNIADIYAELGDKEKAIESLGQAMALVKETGNLGQEATILNSYGLLYSDLGEIDKAIEYYGRSLFLLKYTGDPRKEATTLANLLSVHDRAKHDREAAFFGKLAVNKLQALRSEIRAFERQTQKTYLAKVEETYRRLAEVLIREGRLAEAQQLLNALKDQQNFDAESASAGQLSNLILTPREAELAAKLDAAAKPSAGNDSIPKESARTAAADAFGKTLSQIETEFSASLDARDSVGSIADVADMRAVLAEIEKQTNKKAVAIYLLSGSGNLNALILSADDARSVSVPVKSSVLNAKTKTFWALLQSDRYDPRVAGKELYDLVFKPLEEKLPPGTGSIMWSLDGSLRYIPMAALYDGKQYLVERYNHINFTRADRDRLTRRVTPKWTATAVGTSRGHDVELGGETKHFNPLPGVTEELNMLVTQPKRRGIFDGSILQDEKFTRAAMIEALRSKRPLVHISTHFSFSPGDESRSFLLMGDGTAFTLADMKRQKDMFAGVELLTLSACNTAAQQADANGREVDAFFELAQRLGARSVMATLWPVADNSTPWLMREFYDLKVNRKQNKAEALRNAQLALLNGSAKASRSAVRSDASQVKIVVEGESKAPETATGTRAETFTITKKDAKPFLPDPKRPFAHPFYWSSFVLIGNWR